MSRQDGATTASPCLHDATGVGRNEDVFKRSSNRRAHDCRATTSLLLHRRPRARRARAQTAKDIAELGASVQLRGRRGAGSVAASRVNATSADSTCSLAASRGFKQVLLHRARAPFASVTCPASRMARASSRGARSGCPSDGYIRGHAPRPADKDSTQHAALQLAVAQRHEARLTSGRGVIKASTRRNGQARGARLSDVRQQAHQMGLLARSKSAPWGRSRRAGQSTPSIYRTQTGPRTQRLATDNSLRFPVREFRSACATGGPAHVASRPRMVADEGRGDPLPTCALCRTSRTGQALPADHGDDRPLGTNRARRRETSTTCPVARGAWGETSRFDMQGPTSAGHGDDVAPRGGDSRSA